MKVRRLGRILGRCILAVIGAWVATFVFVIVMAWALSGHDAREARADAIICLGAGMSFTHPMRPGPASERRALSCAALYRAGVADVVVFTGSGNHFASAARAMATLAIREGVPSEAVLVDRLAGSTIQNAAFGLALLPEQPDHVVIVSDPFHLARSWAIFRFFGLADVDVHAARPDAVPQNPMDPDSGRARPGPDGFPEHLSDLDWMVREATAIWFNLARGAAYLAGGAVGLPSETRIAWFN